MPLSDSDIQSVRLFTAIPVPKTICLSLAALPKSNLTGQWQHIDDYHITLRYLGETDQDSIDPIINLLSSVKVKPFEIRLNGLGQFALKNQKILWAAIESTRKLENLTARVNEQLAKAGLEMPAKPYVPHITLARFNKDADLSGYIRQEANNVKYHWKINNFCLYLSQKTAESNSRYREIRRYNVT